jgi:hypothetical protein
MPGLIFRDAVRFASACDAGNPAGRVHAAFANDAVRICIRGDAGVSASSAGASFFGSIRRLWSSLRTASCNVNRGQLLAIRSRANFSLRQGVHADSYPLVLNIN